MLNNDSNQNQTSTLNMSKFWAFRFINVVSLLSIFLLLSILLIPIPYLDKERDPSIVELNLNNSGYSHAIKITNRKLPGKVLSVTFSTHNSDHIIGSTYFGDIKLERDADYFSRFVNCHYQDKRKGLPFRILIVDVYSKVFVFRRYLLLDNQENTYKQIEGSVYVIPEDREPKRVDVSLTDLLKYLPDHIFKMQFQDLDDNVVTQYFADRSHALGTVTLGSFKYELSEKAMNRTLTTISNKSLNVGKVVLTTFYKDNPNPVQIEYFYSLDNTETFYNSVSSLSMALGSNVTYDNFDINRYDNNKSETIYFNDNKQKTEGLLIFEFKHDKYKYEVIVSDRKEALLDLRNKPKLESDDNEETPFERVLVLEYNTKEPKPPNYYLWDRMLYFNRLTIMTHVT